MYTITKLKMWKNPGYTRECVEVPPAGSVKLPAPDYTSTASIRPRKAQIMDELQLPVPFLQLKDMSYLYIEAQDGVSPTPNTVKMFGWITDVREIASSEQACSIYWTPDWWRTCSGSATFGAGTVTRCNDVTYSRPSPSKPRRWKVAKLRKVIDEDGTGTRRLYACIAYTKVVSGTVTQLTYAFFEPNISITYGNTTYDAITINDLYLCRTDECMGINPENIVGAYIVPLRPASTSYVPPKTHASGGKTYAWYESTDIPNRYKRTEYGTDTYITDDMHRCILVDPYGTPIFEVPWGFTIDGSDAYIDASTAGMNVYIALRAPLSYEVIGYQGMLGLAASVPALSVPINENAWSSYVYSYQREYDKRQREIARISNAVGGMSNLGESAISGAIAGGISGKTRAGAIVGAAAGSIGIAADYITSGIFNDQLQAESDKLYSNQASNLLNVGDGTAWYTMNGHWYIVQLEADTVSDTEYDTFISLNGYTCDHSTTSISAFITAGGPLQAQNVVITGNIPPAAKTSIKMKLENGIRIVENNPTGTDPGA